MLSSVLAYFPNAQGADATIHHSVALARRCGARIHGLAVLDTRATEAACLIESAASAAMACEALSDFAKRCDRAQVRLAQACRAVEIECEVRRLKGDPRRLLPPEAQFHDLVVTALDDGRGDMDPTEATTLADFADLMARGVQPMLIVRPRQRLGERVLLTYDGSDASGRAIRSFLQLGLLPEAECRLLVVGSNIEAAQHSFGGMADYCLARRGEMETGWAVGPLRRVLPAYAKKWQAEVAVVGVPRGPRYLQRLRGASHALLRELPHCALFAKS